jgi:serine protease Do
MRADGIATPAALGFLLATSGHAMPCVAPADAAPAIVTQQTPNPNELCGWIGVQVSPMTAASADGLGMSEPYGAIFDQPEPDSPAAGAGIEPGDVLTAINGSPLEHASDFAGIISMMAPGTPVSLDISRNGEAMQLTVILGSTRCGTGG